MLLSKKNVSYSILAVIALLGLVLSLGLYRKAHEYEYQKIKAGFKNDCPNRFAVIQGHIDVHLERIDSLRDFFVGSVEVERDEFNMYVEDFLKKHPGIKSLMWIPEIKAEQRADFEKSVRQQGFEEFEI
ncbi:MAG: CHASE domain-containing protein, partial [Planctomycetes bacterium]|nr:CHASE domain-containing protein [Planctomycetota bacterium]